MWMYGEPVEARSNVNLGLLQADLPSIDSYRTGLILLPYAFLYSAMRVSPRTRTVMGCLVRIESLEARSVDKIVPPIYPVAPVTKIFGNSEAILRAVMLIDQSVRY